MNNLNFSKEIYNIFDNANKLSSGNIIEPWHILCSILTTKNLISLSIGSIFSKIYEIYQNSKNKNTIYFKYTIKFSKKNLIIISNLLSKHKIINTIDYFIELLKQNNNIYLKYFFKSTTIINFNLYFNLTSYSEIKYIKHLFYYITFQKSYIINRQNEIDFVSNTLVQTFKNNVILIGERGVGRFSIINGAVNKLNRNEFNKEHMRKEFYVLDVMQCCITLDSNDVITQKNIICNWILNNDNIVLILSRLENIVDFEILLPVFNLLFLLVRQQKLQFIITINTKMFANFLNLNLLQINLYESLIIKELPIQIIKKILNLIVPQLEQFYKIKLTSDVINKVLSLSKSYNNNSVLPLKAIELLHIICSKFLLIYPKLNFLNKDYFDKIIYKLKNITITPVQEQKIIIKNFKFLLQKRIFGQIPIINKINNALKKTLLGFKATNKPIGSWFLCGPSGTGKTELAKGVSEILFGEEKKMIRFDMSEFMEKHSVSKLIGSPPGYVGYGEKGLLSKAISRQPYCLLLFDEIEKAHPDILNIMLQILDDGRLTDSMGEIIDFTNTLIIFTSNLGCPKNISEFDKEINLHSINYKINEQNISNALKNYFKPEFLNRIQDILIFQPLEYKILFLILNKFIDQFFAQLKLQKFPIQLIINEILKKYLIKLSISPIYGARPLKRLFDELIVEPTVDILLKVKLKTNHLLIYSLTSSNNITYTLIPNL